MAGRKSRSDGRQARSQNTKAARGRKAHVPPIIDLEATIVDEAAATETEQEGERTARPADPEGGADAGESSTAWQNKQQASWMDEMKAFFLGGVHIGRWRVPAAGSLIVLAIFAGGLVGGRLLAPDAPAGDAAGGGERFSALEAVLKTTAQSNQDLASRFDALDAKLDTANATAREARSAADAALGEVRALDASLQDLVSVNADTGNNSPQVAALQQQIEALAEQVEQIALNMSSGDGTGIPAGLNERIASLATALEDLRTSVEDLSERESTETGGDDTVAQSVIDAARTQIAESMEQALVRVDERLAALENGLDATPRDGPGAATAAAARLNKAIDAGSPYQRELTALAAAMPGDPAISAIAAHATTGVATRADLIARFDAIAAALAAAQSGIGETDTGDGDLIGDVWSRVTDLVKVQKSTEPGSRVLVAAVETARERITDGDLAAAADALAEGGDGLTEAATGWIDAAQARAQVDAEMDGLLRRAVLKAFSTDDPSGS